MAWTFAMLSTAAVIALFAMVGVVQRVQAKLQDRSEQSLCIAHVQAEFDRHISQLVIDSIAKDNQGVLLEAKALQDINDNKLGTIDQLCPAK